MKRRWWLLCVVVLSESHLVNMQSNIVCSIWFMSISVVKMLILCNLSGVVKRWYSDICLPKSLVSIHWQHMNPCKYLLLVDNIWHYHMDVYNLKLGLVQTFTQNAIASTINELYQAFRKLDANSLSSRRFLMARLMRVQYVWLHWYLSTITFWIDVCVRTFINECVGNQVWVVRTCQTLGFA